MLPLSGYPDTMERTKDDLSNLALELGQLSATVGDSYDLAEPIADGYAIAVGPYGQGQAVLDQIVALDSLQAACESLIRDRVAIARREGLSWEKIGRSLGMSRQSAWEKYRDA